MEKRVSDEDKKILTLFKKSQGIEKMGMGDFETLCKAFEIPKDDWKEISSGMVEGNFDHLYYKGQNYYSYILDPLYDRNPVLMFQSHGQRNHQQLVEIVNRFFQVERLLIWGKPFEKKKCWECGKEFTFLDIAWQENLPAWRGFERAMDCWEDNHCGCN